MAAARILVVDDDSLLLDVVIRMLCREGYAVLPAHRPQQALDLVRSSHPIDVVLADIRMPEMSGTQLVREMADLSPRTARVLMTAGIIDATDVPEGVPVLRKPFRTRDLLAAVEAALTRSAQVSVALQVEI